MRLFADASAERRFWCMDAYGGSDVFSRPKLWRQVFFRTAKKLTCPFWAVFATAITASTPFLGTSGWFTKAGEALRRFFALRILINKGCKPLSHRLSTARGFTKIRKGGLIKLPERVAAKQRKSNSHFLYKRSALAN